MRKLIFLLIVSFTFASCTSNTETNTNVTTQEPPKALTCDENIEASKARLLEVNENPDVALEFLGKVESGTKCFLKVKITQAIGEQENSIYSLFNTKAEKNYGNYTTEEEMNTAITELTQ